MGAEVRTVRTYRGRRRLSAWMLVLASGGSALLVGACGQNHREANPTAASTSATAAPHSTATASVTSTTIPSKRSETTTTNGSQPTTKVSSEGTVGVAPSTVPASVPTVPSEAAPGSGVYSNGSSGTPRYLISLRQQGRAGGDGTITFVYQDGRSQTVANYTARFGVDQTLQMQLSNGKSIVGIFGLQRFTLSNCGRALQFIPVPSRCQFSYIAPS
jgi:hypothetical protein